MCTVSLNLLIRGDGTEHDFGELAPSKGTICDATRNSQLTCVRPPKTEDLYAPYDFQRMLDNGNGQMCPVIDQSRNIVLRHLWKLFLKYALQSSENDEALPLSIIIDHSKFNFAVALFNHGGLGIYVSSDL